MKKIKISKPSKDELDKLGISKWSPWSCEPSIFDWEYSDNETAYVFEGKVKVVTDEETVIFGAGDLVEFPSGLKCRWEVIELIRKVYKMG